VGARILILEDDPVLRRQVGRVFSARGCEVVETESVAGFVHAAADRTFDACLLDLWLPDGNGLDAWEQVRQSQEHAVTVVMSGEATPEARARAHSLGCANLLAKPFDLSALLAAYGTLLAS
jgi:DNA-binding response OmpR family regulator